MISSKMKSASESFTDYMIGTDKADGRNQSPINYERTCKNGKS